jgi:hypothetical protein
MGLRPEQEETPVSLVQDAAARRIRTDRIDARILEVIDREEWIVMHVFPTGDAGDEIAVPYSYTIGMSLLGLPELLVTGLGGEASQSVLNSIGAVGKRDGLRAGPLSGALSGGYVLEMREADRTRIGDLTARLDWFWQVFPQPEQRIMQALWPRRDGVTPLDAGLAADERDRFLAAQPLFIRRLN